MARIKKTVTLKNCYIDEKNLYEIQEIGKESTQFYSVYELMHEFSGIEGVSITLSVDEDLPATPDEGADSDEGAEDV